MTSGEPARLLAGEVGKPHGLGGEVYVLPISDDPHRFDPGSVLLREAGAPLTVEEARVHRNRLLVKFQGVDARDEAESLRGPVYVSVEQARELEGDEFWSHELVGCELIDENGGVLGRVERVDPGAAHDLLIISTPVGERLVPAVRNILREVDLEARRIVAAPPEGLLD